MKRKLCNLGVSFAILGVISGIFTCSATSVFANYEEKFYNGLNVDKFDFYTLGYEESEFVELAEVVKNKADFMTDYMGITSLQYAISVGDEILISSNSGVYSKTQNTPLTSDNMYAIGSISKLYTTVAIMQLIEDEKLELDEPLYKYLEDFVMVDERYKDITIRMLLNHSSGLYGSTFVDAFVVDESDRFSKDEFLELISKQTLKSNAGEFSIYCNDGFTLLEILIEEVTGVSFTDYVTKNIIEPLGLENTKTPIQEFNGSKLAKTYNPVTGEEMPRDMVLHTGTGGLYSTAEELIKFAKIFTTDNNILSEESINLMFAEEYKNGIWTKENNAMLTYGLGFDNVALNPFNEYGVRALSKSGDTLLTHSNLTILDEQDIIISVLSSGGSSTINQVFASSIASELLKITNNLEIENIKSFEFSHIEDMPKEFIENEGLYISGSAMSEIYINEDGNLQLKDVLSGIISNFIYTSDGYFLNEDNTIRISFETLSNSENDELTYIYLAQIVDMQPIGYTKMGMFFGQKMEVNELSEDVFNAWQNRNGKVYFCTTYGSSNQMYSTALPMARFVYNDDMYGYIINAKIIDENTALNYIEIPIFTGRDSMDYVFYQEDGIEYLDINGNVYISEETLENLPISANNDSFEVEVSEFDKYLKIPSELVGKTIEVTEIVEGVETSLGENSAYAIYNSLGLTSNFSSVSGKTASTITDTGYIVFIGDSGSIFNIRIS